MENEVEFVQERTVPLQKTDVSPIIKEALDSRVTIFQSNGQIIHEERRSSVLQNAQFFENMSRKSQHSGYSPTSSLQQENPRKSLFASEIKDQQVKDLINVFSQQRQSQRISQPVRLEQNDGSVKKLVNLFTKNRSSSNSIDSNERNSAPIRKMPLGDQFVKKISQRESLNIFNKSRTSITNQIGSQAEKPIKSKKIEVFANTTFNQLQSILQEQFVQNVEQNETPRVDQVEQVKDEKVEIVVGMGLNQKNKEETIKQIFDEESLSIDSQTPQAEQKLSITSLLDYQEYLANRDEEEKVQIKADTSSNQKSEINIPQQQESKNIIPHQQELQLSDYDCSSQSSLDFQTLAMSPKLIKAIQAQDDLVLCGHDPLGRLLYVKPIELEEQEVLCQNCYETFSMEDVDSHSQTCAVELQDLEATVRITTVRSESIYLQVIQDFDQRIFKLIQAFITRLQTGFDYLHEYKPSSVTNEERRLINKIIQAANTALSVEMPSVQRAAEQLREIEEVEDLCELMQFKNHLMFNRISSLVNSKEQAMERQSNSRVQQRGVQSYTEQPLTEHLINLNFRCQRKPQLLEKDNGVVWVVSDFSDCSSNRDEYIRATPTRLYSLFQKE